jgi:hypothetical protein
MVAATVDADAADGRVRSDWASLAPWPVVPASTSRRSPVSRSRAFWPVAPASRSSRLAAIRRVLPHRGTSRRRDVGTGAMFRQPPGRDPAGTG